MFRLGEGKILCFSTYKSSIPSGLREHSTVAYIATVGSLLGTIMTKSKRKFWLITLLAVIIVPCLIMGALLITIMTVKPY